jgi:cyclopropane fatty-acyl-phospholipid synthase-like methyltransferase
MSKYSGYRRLAEDMVDAVGAASTVLDVGAGPGHLSKILAARGKFVVAIDANDAMLSGAEANCASEIADQQIEIHKANLESISAKELTEVRSENFRPPYDALVMLNVFYAIRDKPQFLAFLRSVVKPAGILALSGPGDDVDLYKFYASLPDAESSDLSLFKEVNNRMFTQGLLTQSVNETTQLLTKAGFEISRTETTVFSNQGMLIVAKAP